MHPDTEQRIVRAAQYGALTTSEIAREWDVSDRTVLRILDKHGVHFGGKKHSNFPSSREVNPSYHSKELVERAAKRAAKRAAG